MPEPTNEELLNALQERADFIKKKYPTRPKCKCKGCKNKVDVTMSGIETVCPYHRMIWDDFMYPRAGTMEMSEIRKEFVEYLKITSKEELDKIAIEMAKVPINWEC